MKSVTFKGKNNTTIEVRFEHRGHGLYEPSIWHSKGDLRLIPLLLDKIQISRTKEKLADLKDIEYDFNLFREIVAGACSLTMKRGG